MKRRTVLSLAASAASLAVPLRRARAQEQLKLWHVFNLETEYYMREGLRTFRESQPEVTVEERIVPSAQYQAEFIRAIAAAEVPDVICIDNPDTAFFADQGAILDISDRLAESQVIKADAYRPNSWATVMWRDAAYGVPRDSNTIGIYYNKDAFAEVGLDPERPPATWSELQGHAKRLVNAEKRRFGITFAARQWEDAVFQWLPFVWQAGGDIDRLDGPETVAALEYWQGFLTQGITTPDVLTMSQSDAVSRFIAGNSAMAISGPWDTPRVTQNAKFAWAVAPMPVKDGLTTRASALGGWNWCIPAEAAQPDLAWQLIEWMARPELMATSWRAGRLPPRLDVEIESQEYPQARDTYLRQLEDARPRGPHPQWPEISRSIQLAMQQTLTGGSDAKTALAEAAVKVNGILQQIPL